MSRTRAAALHAWSWRARLRAALRRDRPDITGGAPTAANGDDELALSGVAVVCVTNRPQFLDDVAANVARQARRPDHLVLVLNGDGFDDDAVQRTVDTCGVPAIVLRQDSGTLGERLNLGIAATTARYVAKFDDDDLYGPQYLAEALAAIRRRGVGIVGKHTYIAHLAATDRTLVRFPGHEHRHTTYVAGGTLLIDRARCRGLRFAHLDVGEDQGLVADCLRGGHTVYATSRFQFVQRRADHNTWRVDDARFAAGSQPIGQGLRLDVAFQASGPPVSHGDGTGK